MQLIIPKIDWEETTMKLHHLRWPQAREELGSGKVVVVPIGSVEQHGPHLPVGTDFLVADKLGNMISERSEECIVAPTIPFGYAEYHSDFAGTVSTNSSATLGAYLGEIASHYVRHGTRHVLFVNSHGGNMVALDQLCYELRERGVFAATVLWWDVISRLRPDYSPAGHAEWIESSLMLAYDESLVDMDIAKAPLTKGLGPEDLDLVDPHTAEFCGVPIHVRLRTHDFSETGDMPEPNLSPGADTSIPPSRARREIGEEIFEVVADFICRLIPVIRSVDPKIFAGS